MRFRCFAAILICCIGLQHCWQNTVVGQIRQVSVGCDDPGCDDSGCVPCYRHRTCPKRCGCKVIYRHYHHAPCPPEDGQPRGGEETIPREAVPGVAPGVFVAPPQSGVVEGPTRGVELPGLSVSLPELTLSLPRVRLRGLSYLSRDARMVMDRSSAPYVTNPHYAASVAAQRQAFAVEQAYAQRLAEQRSRQAQENDAQNTRGAKKKDASTRSAEEDAYREDMKDRIESLEKCFELQMKALNGCIDQLKQLKNIPTQANHLPADYYRPMQQNLPEPTQVTQYPPRKARTAHFIPENVSHNQVSQTRYQEPAPSSRVEPYPARPRRLRRLPTGDR